MRRILILLGVWLPMLAGAQQKIPKSFSVEPPVFIKELESFIKDANSDAGNAVIKEFVPYWNENKITSQTQRAVINTCNKFLEKKFRAVPEFESYLATINAMVRGNQQARVESWQKMVDYYMLKTRKNFLDFLVLTKGLFSENTLVEASNRKWQTSASDFELTIIANEPVVKFNSPVSIYCYTAGDTILIHKTKGTFYSNQDLWVGEKGVVDWRRAWLDTTKVYAELGNYRIDMKRTEFSADTVTFYNKLMFANALKGRLMEKAYMAWGGGDKALSPRFESFERSYDFPQFKNEVSFKGGFGMKGSKIIGLGDAQNPATFIFTYKGKPKLKVMADEFVVGKEHTIAQKTSVVIMVEGDSIFHPQVVFNYNYANKLVVLDRESKDPITAAPFLDSYHRIEFYVDEVTWKLEHPKMDFKNLNPEKSAMFESFNFYRVNRYEKLQGILDEHPLWTLRKFCFQNDTTKKFNIDDFAAFVGVKRGDVTAFIVDLHDNGFVIFNPKNGEIRVREKTFEWFKAYNKKTDYDVIQFISTIDASKRPHASLNFENHDLNVQGVPRFIFSDSQSVYVEPYDQTINIRRNRDIDFAGHLHAGRVDFYSKVGPNQGFLFQYEQFKVQFTNVELQLSLEDSAGRTLPLKNRMKNVTGRIIIDKPKNKRGFNGPNDEYPVLESVKNANVFYDYESTQGKVNYDPIDFFFDVDPFSIDSLDNFDIASMTFDGTLHAGGIMPDFRHILKYMPDTSLGFFRDTMDYPLYVKEGKPKGTGHLSLSLSVNGFHGAGHVDYLASHSRTDDYFLFLDSANSNVKTFDLKRTDIYPTAKGNNVYERWIPYQDTMFVSTIDEDIAMFENRAYLKGNAVLTPKTLYGDGKLSWEDAEMFSDRFNFSPVTTKSDRATFRLASSDPGKFAIIINDVKAFVDFDKRYAEFKVIKPGQIVDLPYNQYQMAFTDYKWNMDKKTIDMTAAEVAGSGSTNVQKNFFRSIHPEQDSLFFYAGNATYYLSDYLVVAEKVPYIHTADARVVPDSNKVVIEPNAVMRTLHNATILADTLKRYHTIVRSEVDILGRKNFRGSGYYSYTDRTKKVFEIFFENIGVNKIGRTSATGPITDSMNFTLSPHIQFKGTATLISTDRNMEFDGYLLPQHSMNYPQSQWFKHTQRVNPDSVFIKFQDPRNEEKQQLYAGIYVSSDSTHVYATFFNRKRAWADLALTEGEGVMYYDDKTGELKAGDWDKFFKGKLIGNAIYLNEKTNTVYSEGKVNFGLPKSRFNLKAAGTITGNMKDTSYVADIAMMFDIPMPDNAMKIFADTIFEAAAFSDELKYNNPRYIKSILEIMDFPDAEGKKASEKDQQKQVESMREDNAVKMMAELTRTLLFTDVKMVWNTSKRSFTSKGKLGLTAIGKTKIDKKINGKIEITKKRSGDEVKILIEPVAGTWFYFQFLRGQMFVLSSNPAFNQAIKDMMEKMSTPDYKLRIASAVSMNNFKRGDIDEEDEE